MNTNRAMRMFRRCPRPSFTGMHAMIMGMTTATAHTRMAPARPAC